MDISDLDLTDLAGITVFVQRFPACFQGLQRDGCKAYTAAPAVFRGCFARSLVRLLKRRRLRLSCFQEFRKCVFLLWHVLSDVSVLLFF